MPVMSSYLKKMQPDVHPNQQYLFMLGGSLFLIAALIGEMRHHQLRALAALSTGLGMILFGYANIKLWNTRWHLPALVIAGALWGVGSYWMVTTALTR